MCNTVENKRLSARALRNNRLADTTAVLVARLYYYIRLERFSIFRDTPHDSLGFVRRTTNACVLGPRRIKGRAYICNEIVNLNLPRL